MCQKLWNIHSLRENIKKELHGLYPEREINSICDILFMYRLNLQRHEIGLRRHQELAKEDAGWIEKAVDKIRDHYPVQYITGSTEFAGIPMKIAPGVLIPRPETEELVDWIAGENKLDEPRILDIGTGSGCIALALNKLIPGSEVFGTDISEEALALATENSELLNLEVRFTEHDIRTLYPDPKLGNMDIIVSNPPYIPESEKSGMDINVSRFEPHGALFVPDSDPLVFYSLISEFSKVNLNRGGMLYFESHEKFAGQVQRLMENHGFTDINLRRDINGKYRMLKGRKQ